MKQTARELLVTTKVAESWQQDFDSNVDELMGLVSKVDTEQHVENATELLDVYHSTKQMHAPHKKITGGRPFEFTVFRN